MEIKALTYTYLKIKPFDPIELLFSELKEIKAGSIIKITEIKDKEDNHAFVVSDQRYWYIFKPHWEVLLNPKVFNGEEINWSYFNCRISKYFTVGEATKYDVKRIPTNLAIKNNILALAKELDIVREQWGFPIQVISWYRPPNISGAVGGALNFQHLQGSAADIYPSDKSKIYAFQDWLDKGLWKNKALGKGANKGFVHVDLRSGKIRWNY